WSSDVCSSDLALGIRSRRSHTAEGGAFRIVVELRAVKQKRVEYVERLRPKLHAGSFGDAGGLVQRDVGRRLGIHPELAVVVRRKSRRILRGFQEAGAGTAELRQ